MKNVQLPFPLMLSLARGKEKGIANDSSSQSLILRSKSAQDFHIVKVVW